MFSQSRKVLEIDKLQGCVVHGRGRGIGSELLQRVLQRVEPQERVVLTTIATTEKLYARYGFRIARWQEVPMSVLSLFLGHTLKKIRQFSHMLQDLPSDWPPHDTCTRDLPSMFSLEDLLTKSSLSYLDLHDPNSRERAVTCSHSVLILSR